MSAFSPPVVARDFSRAAADYDAHASLQKHVLAGCVERLAPLLSPDARVLDAGCGTGALKEFLRGGGSSWRAAGVDISHAMCRSAYPYPVGVYQASVDALPFSGGAFDAVISSLVLQWVNDVPRALAEFLRVLSPGGVAAVSTFAHGTLHELESAFAAAGGEARVSGFSGLAGNIPEGWAAADLHAETVTEYYPSLAALMRGLKAIGAVNKRADRPRGLTPPGFFARAEQAYRRDFPDARGLPLTWRVETALLKKAGV